MSDDAADDALVFETDLEAPPEKVWRAIATPELRQAWLGEPEAGPAEIVRAEPGERLDLAWPTRDGDSLVSFEISPGEDGGAHLVITHRTVAPKVVRLPARPATVARAWRMAA